MIALPTLAVRRALALALVAPVLALATLAGLVGSAGSASATEQPACSCQTQATATQARAANAIFTATVVAVEREPVDNNPSVFNDTYTVSVEEIYKGNLVTSEATFRTDRVFGQCGGVFDEGTEIMVFAQAGEPLRVRGCAGTAVADPALVTEVEAIFGSGTPPVPPTPFEVTYTTPADQPGAPASLTRAAAPGLALMLVALAGLVVVRRLGRPRI